MGEALENSHRRICEGLAAEAAAKNDHNAEYQRECQLIKPIGWRVASVRARHVLTTENTIVAACEQSANFV
jgi:hypothetical protein